MNLLQNSEFKTAENTRRFTTRRFEPNYSSCIITTQSTIIYPLLLILFSMHNRVLFRPILADNVSRNLQWSEPLMNLVHLTQCCNCRQIHFIQWIHVIKKITIFYYLNVPHVKPATRRPTIKINKKKLPTHHTIKRIIYRIQYQVVWDNYVRRQPQTMAIIDQLINR